MMMFTATRTAVEPLRLWMTALLHQKVASRFSCHFFITPSFNRTLDISIRVWMSVLVR
jgi:hypothetical protein